MFLNGRVVNAWLNGVAAVLAFILVATTIRRFFPPFVPMITPKLEFFAEHKDSIDTVFVGTSRTLHGISPKVFDETLRQAGFPSCSFNAGAESMGLPEATEMVFSLLAMKPTKLRRVFAEVSFLQNLPKVSETTERDIYWQDLRSLAFGLRRARIRRHWDPQQALHDLYTYPEFYALNFSNIGRGLDWLGLSPPLSPTAVSYAGGDLPLGPDGDGFVPITGSIAPELRAQYHEDLKEAAHWKPLHGLGFDPLRLALEAKGISLFYVVPPNLGNAIRTSAADCPPGSVFRYDNPAKFPLFFRDDRRFNPDHLNSTGAREFTRALAEDFARRLREPLSP